MTRCPGPDLLLLLREGLADQDDEEARAMATLRTHVEGCARCRASTEGLDRALTPPPLPFSPAELLPAIKERLARREGQAVVAEVAPALSVRLLCTYCRDGLGGPDPVYCATCLAPHHGDCFAEHGRCAATGCEGRQVVRTADPAPVRRSRQSGLALVLLGAIGAGGVAALTSSTFPPEPEAIAEHGGHDTGPVQTWSISDEPAPAPPPVRSTPVVEEPVLRAHEASALLLGPSLQREEVDDPELELRARLERPVSLDLKVKGLSAALRRLSERYEVSLALAPEVVESDRLVQLELRQVPIRAALDMILAPETGLTWSIAHGTVRVRLREREPAAPPRHRGARPSHPVFVRPAALLERVRLAVMLAVGPSAWAHPTDARVEGTRLIVRQTPRGHAAIEAMLAEARPPELGFDAWFAPGEPSRDPALRAALAVESTLLRRRGELDATELLVLDALEQLRPQHDLTVRIDPPARERLLARRPTVRARLVDVSLYDALEVISSAADLVWDIDREGVLVRTPDVPGLEERLSRAAEEALAGAPSANALPRARVEELESAITAPSGDPHDPLLWIGSPGSLCEELARALGRKAIVHASTGLLSSRAPTAFPAHTSVGSVLEVALREAGIRHAWTSFEGKPLLALDAGEAPLLEATAALSKLPWPDAPDPLRALRGEASEALSQALSALGASAKVPSSRQTFFEALERVETTRARLAEVDRGLRFFATLREDTAKRRAFALRELIGLAKLHVPLRDGSGDRARAHFEAERARVTQLLPFSVEPAQLAAVRRRLMDREAWDAVFPRGFLAWHTEVAVAERERLARGVDRLFRLGIEWVRLDDVDPRRDDAPPFVRLVRPGSPAAKARLAGGEVIVGTLAEDAPDLLGLASALARLGEEEPIALRVAIPGGGVLKVTLQLTR